MRRLSLLLVVTLLVVILAVAVSRPASPVARVVTGEPAACVSANFSRDCATGAEYPYPRPGEAQNVVTAPATP